MWQWFGRVPHKWAIVLACWISPSRQSMARCFTDCQKCPSPPHLLCPCLKIKSAGIWYFYNFWDLLLEEEGGGRRIAEQPQQVGSCHSIHPLELPSGQCKLSLVEVSPLLHVADMKADGVRVSGWGCQKTAEVTDCLGSKQQVCCSLFYISSVQRLKTQGILHFLVLWICRLVGVLGEILAPF